MYHKQHLRHESKEKVLCPYANGKRCVHPRCVRLTGMECYRKENTEREKLIKSYKRFARILKNASSYGKCVNSTAYGIMNYKDGER